MYFAWVVSYVVVLLVLGATTERYLFFLYPAVLTIGFVRLFEGCSVLWGERHAQFVVGGFALAWLVSGMFVPVEFLRGPADAAAYVTQKVPTRVLYAGTADGDFTFAIRSFDPKLQSTVVAAAKLPASEFEPQALERFCRQYGINWIVVENVPGKFKWSALLTSPASSMQFERSIRLTSSHTRWRQGTIDIYRFNGPPNPPGGLLKIPVPKFGGSIGVRL
jgi:hypothetical protein